MDRPGHRQHEARRAQGVVQPKAITTAMLPQFKTCAARRRKQHLLLAGEALPGRVLGRRQEETERGLSANGGQKIAPALNRLVSYLENEYLPAGRTSTGWSALPNGAAWYAAHIKDSTNLPLTPDEVHALGLKEVARIQQQLTARSQAGLRRSGKAAAAVGQRRGKFKIFTTDEQVLDAYRAIYAQVQTKLPTYFTLLPKAKLELQLEPELTRATASDHYTPSAADGSHPGVFWPVVNDPKEYSRVGMVTCSCTKASPATTCTPPCSRNWTCRTSASSAPRTRTAPPIPKAGRCIRKRWGARWACMKIRSPTTAT
jgi:uncharacterized protein (DUF885 family)